MNNYKWLVLLLLFFVVADAVWTRFSKSINQSINQSIKLTIKIPMKYLKI